MSQPFDLQLEEAAGLSEEERLMLLRLLAMSAVTEAQAREVLAIHSRHRSSLLSILLALRYINPRQYAEHLAEPVPRLLSRLAQVFNACQAAESARPPDGCQCGRKRPW